MKQIAGVACKKIMNDCLTDSDSDNDDDDKKSIRNVSWCRKGSWNALACCKKNVSENVLAINIVHMHICK